MCKCIENIEQRALDMLLKQLPEARITEQIEIQNKSLMCGSGKWQLYSEVAGRYEDGVRRKKFEVKFLYTFCPFCGERIEQLG